MNPIAELLGQCLVDVSPVEWGSCTLVFEEGHLHIHNPVRLEGRDSLERFVGCRVLEIIEVDDREFTMGFQDGAKISVSMDPAHYSGPEAMGYCGRENLIVIWRGEELGGCHLVYDAPVSECP